MLRYIDKVVLRLSLVDPASTTLRHFYSRIRSSRALTSNPKCVIDLQNADNVAEPTLQVVYKDKKELNLKTRKFTIDQIYSEVDAHSRKLKIEADIKNA